MLRKPETYLVKSIVVTVLIAFPLGIVPIVQGMLVSKRYKRGDYAGAIRMSKRAKQWLIISLVVGVIETAVLVYLGWL